MEIFAVSEEVERGLQAPSSPRVSKRCVFNHDQMLVILSSSRITSSIANWNHQSYFRHSSPTDRPDFVTVVQQLSLPDTRLLRWSDVDKGVHPEADRLGADLCSAHELYTDLQTLYST